VAIKLHKQVVVIGGGFGGLAVTRALAREAVQVTLVDRRNHHLFQPLLYQVAMAGLSPAEIAVPIRSVHPEIFCIGDAAAFLPEIGKAPLPGVSAVAMQQGRFVVRQIGRRIDGRPLESFVYRDKGSMATIGRSRAVAELGKIRLSGFIAWLTWLLVHMKADSLHG
jgi:NADH dehydrogenase FAD-containing subunit